MSRYVLSFVASLLLGPILFATVGARNETPPKEERRRDDSDDDPFGASAQERPGKSVKSNAAPKTTPAQPAPIDNGNDPSAAHPMRPSGAEKVGTTTRRQLAPADLQTGEAAILRALDQKANFNFVDMPLEEVVDQLQERFRIAIRIDPQATREGGVSKDVLVSLSAKNLSLQSALHLILRDTQLAWTIWSDGLFITAENNANDDEMMVCKLYDVSDLLSRPEDRPYSGGLPTVIASKTFNNITPGSGTGPESINQGMLYGTSVQRSSPDAMGNLKALIELAVATKTWSDNGGSGTITEHDKMLCISQTYPIQIKVAAFLAELKAKRRAEPTLLASFRWLWLDGAKHKQLVASDTPGNIVLDAAKLHELDATEPGFQGQITCASGQLVHLSTGDRRLMILSCIPVVGSGIGYSPIVEAPNVGVAIECRASASPGESTAFLEVQCVVSRLGKPLPTVRVGGSWPSSDESEGGGKDAAPRLTTHEPAGSSSCPVERPNMPTAQLAASARVPLGKPVVLGGITFAPAGSAGTNKATANPTQLYLIATVTNLQ